GNADGARVDLALMRDDLLMGEDRVVDRLAVEVSVAHDLVAAQNLGIELERPVHVLHRDAEMLDTLEPPCERPVVAAARPASRSGLSGSGGGCSQGRRSDAGNQRRPCCPHDIAALDAVRTTAFLYLGHRMLLPSGSQSARTRSIRRSAGDVVKFGKFW